MIIFFPGRISSRFHTADLALIPKLSQSAVNGRPTDARADPLNVCILKTWMSLQGHHPSGWFAVRQAMGLVSEASFARVARARSGPDSTICSPRWPALTLTWPNPAAAVSR